MPAGRAAVLSKPSANPGLALLQNSTLWLDASDMTPGAQWLRNKGTGGRSLDARLGSVGSAQIVNGALKVPGVMGNYASTPHSTALNITGDIDLRCRANFTTWGPSADWSFITKDQTSRSWNLFITPGRVLTFYWWDSSNTFSQVSSTATVSSSLDGTTLDVRMTFDADNGSGQREIRFYTKNASSPLSDNSGWTQLGTALTAAGVGSLRSTTDLVGVGGRPAANVPNGSIFRAMILNGINGSVVFDADFTTQPTLATSFVESSSNAATVTINSTTGVDTNDPLFLPHTGTNYLHFPQVAGNFASAPHIAAYSMTSTMEIVTRCSLPDWTPTAGNDPSILGKRSGGTNFLFFIEAVTGRLTLYNGTTGAAVTPSGGTFIDGNTYWLKATVSGGNATFFYAPDQSTEPSSWTQIGTPQAFSLGATNGAALTVGESGAANVNFSVYRSILRSSPGGTTVFDANFSTNTNQSSFTESSANAATVTINRSATGRKSVMVTRPILLFGTDDYLEVVDNALLDFAAGESLTAVIVMRIWGIGGSNYSNRVSKGQGGTTKHWTIYNNDATNTTNASIGDGLFQTIDTGETYASGSLHMSSLVRNTVADTLMQVRHSTGSPTTDITTAGLENADPLFVGKAAGATPYYSDYEVAYVALFRSALTTTELGQIASYLGV